jgi:hypothetical protein
MHGQCIGTMDRQLANEEDTLQWLMRGGLRGETGSEIIAAQDQVLQILYCVTKILQTETDRKRRLYTVW